MNSSIGVGAERRNLIGGWSEHMSSAFTLHHVHGFHSLSIMPALAVKERRAAVIALYRSGKSQADILRLLGRISSIQLKKEKVYFYFECSL